MNDDVIELIKDNSEAIQLYQQHGERDFAKNIDIANILKQSGHIQGAIYFFDASVKINPNSQHVLLAKLLLQVEHDISLNDSDVETLKRLDFDCYRYLTAKQSAATITNNEQRIELLKDLGSAVESFASGSEPDWLYLRQAIRAIPTLSKSNNANDRIPRRLFSYWDKNPPEAIRDNVEYHKNLGFFDVTFADKEIASEMIFSYFGSHAKRLFLNLRHPSEESDFFRCHAVYAYGGYYFDADDQIISVEAFRNHALSATSSLFFLSSSGPIRYGSFGSMARSPILEECIRTTMYNCMHEPDLSMWLKTGPGVITRAIVRHYHRAFNFGDPLPDIVILPEHMIGNIIRAVKVDYRGDERDWRVFEQKLRSGANG